MSGPMKHLEHLDLVQPEARQKTKPFNVLKKIEQGALLNSLKNGRDLNLHDLTLLEGKDIEETLDNTDVALRKNQKKILKQEFIKKTTNTRKT